MKGMKFAAAVACSFVVAQGQAPRAKEGRYVAIGCVREQSAQTDGRRGATSGKTFFITDVRDKTLTYRLDGDPDVLGFHVGHMIEVAGDLSAEARAQAGTGEMAPTLEVKSLIYISRTCSR